jgi:L,D-transpeptidase catalytic domain
VQEIYPQIPQTGYGLADLAVDSFIEVRGKTVLIMHSVLRFCVHVGLIPMINRLSQFCALAATLSALSGCGTVSDLVTSNLPERHSGRPSIVVSLREQEAYLYRGKNRTASSRISSGREGYRTPVGRFQVIRKDEDHRSSLYGDYVDNSGRVVKANVDSRRDPKPPHSHFVGTPMPYFVEFSPGYGLHQGYLPGVPASHGCIRMPYWKARQFYNAAHIGTPVVVKP